MARARASISFGLAAIVLSACAGQTFGVRVTFDDAADARAAQAVEVTLVAACPADPTSEPINPSARSVTTRMGPTALPSVPIQRYGLMGRAWSAGCGVVAAGCVEVDLNGAGRTLDIALHHVDSGRCVASSVCTAMSGACVGADAGVVDSGTMDGGGTDGGTMDSGATDSGPTDSGADAGPTDSGTMPDAWPPSCPPLASRPVVEVVDPITSATTWDCSHTWSLHTEITVASPGVLTVDPGTVVVGGSTGGHTGALLVERGAELIAQGTAAMPIVFTSASPVGSRASGDWGGLLFSGRAHTGQSTGVNATINTLGGTSYGARFYGPTVAGAEDETYRCAVLEYVRVEFTGAAAFGAGDTFAALTFAGCGSETVVDHVQLHRGHDDGVLVYGGTFDMRNVVVSASEEDVLDWNYGWQGRMQHVLAWQWPVSAIGGGDGIPGQNLFEADGNDTPPSQPTIYNLTFLGGSDATEIPMALDTGTYGVFRSMIVDAPGASLGPIVDICGANTVTAAMSSMLSISNSVMTDHFPTESCVETFDERAWACGTPTTTRCLASIGLSFATGGDYTSPSFASTAAQRALCTATPPDDGFFDPTATYCGAIGTTDWTSGWTAFPRN